MGDVSDELQHDADACKHDDGPLIATASSAHRTKRTLFIVLLVVVTAGAIALGAWQIERRAWKLDLVAAVDARVHAPPMPAPGPAKWSGITAEHDAYRRLRVTGRFDHAHETLVHAATGRGEGSWLMTPLRTDAGWSVLINRGFLPSGGARPSRQNGSVTVIGLLRVTEPQGALLRANDPHRDRWYSRDVAAIAAARGLDEVAPYFIDADDTPNPGGYPVGGLTVVAFRNVHLSYAITWFALAGLSACGLWFLLRER